MLSNSIICMYRPAMHLTGLLKASKGQHSILLLFLCVRCLQQQLADEICGLKNDAFNRAILHCSGITQIATYDL